uniref:Midnolin n=1 Tax=Cyclopterus lumpus TaxID=8103 RepID=A0A8C2W984_CYCLU
MDQHPSARSCTSRGASSCEAVPTEPSMNLYIHSTTGTRFELSLPQEETVDGLKRRLSQRLKVPRERLALLHKETRLSSGKLQDLGISDGSKLTLVPTVEAGLMSQASRPEQSVMQALESLTETQVRRLAALPDPPADNRPFCVGRAAGGVCFLDVGLIFQAPGQTEGDFLSGRSPLTLALRVGDHMMFVQLQLAAQQSPAVPNRSGGGAHGGRSPLAFPHPQQPLIHTATPAPTSHQVPSSPSSRVSLPSPLPSTAPPAAAPDQPPLAPSGPSGPSSPSGASSPSTRSRKPGAIIESFVNHAPGVFSGTFFSSGRPRRDIGTILQILNDLLSATRHYQGMPPSLTQLRYQTQCGSPASPSPPIVPPPTLHPLVQCQSQIRMCKPPGDRVRQTENRATRCKVERLQVLMQQKRLRRKARRDQRAPYQWLPNRKAGRSNSNSSMSSEGSMDLDFDDSVWKPDVKTDLKSEFVMA